MNDQEFDLNVPAAPSLTLDATPSLTLDPAADQAVIEEAKKPLVLVGGGVIRSKGAVP